MIGVLLVFLGLVLAAVGWPVLCAARRIDQVALVTLLLLAVATRPGVDRHRADIARTITADPFAGGQMQSGAARAAMASEVSRRVEYEDYGLFTVALRYRSVISVGLFGRVFVGSPQR